MTQTRGFDRGKYRATLTAATGTTGGGVLSLANPQGIDLLVTRLIINVATASAGVATIDAGIAANGTTSADNLIDGLSVQATGVSDNIKNAGTNGKAGVRWNSNQFLTITASATTVPMVASVIIEYVPL